MKQFPPMQSRLNLQQLSAFLTLADTGSFGDAAEALVAELDGGRVVAFALFFTNFSTFLCKPGLYLEDLFVEPAQRVNSAS